MHAHAEAHSQAAVQAQDAVARAQAHGQAHAAAAAQAQNLAVQAHSLSAQAHQLEAEATLVGSALNSQEVRQQSATRGHHVCSLDVSISHAIHAQTVKLHSCHSPSS